MILLCSIFYFAFATKVTNYKYLMPILLIIKSFS